MEPRPAATVIVARPGERSSIDVLLVRRSARSRFAPGFVVFPGGVVERSDAVLAEQWFGSTEEAARACAIRELSEETGLVLTGHGLVEAPGAEPGPADIPVPSVEQIREIGRWVAPESLPVRFDARFFAVAAGPDLRPAPDGVETDRAWWATPREVLSANRGGAVPLLWPTIKTLEALASCRSVGEVLELRVEQVAPPLAG